MTEIPTYTSAALGYRIWRTDGRLLKSTGKGVTAWRPGRNIFTCWEHISPAEDCTCGLYAYHELTDIVQALRHQSNDHMAPVVGAVAFRGHVESHYHGLRGEEACILALALLPGCDSPEARKQAHQLAEMYRVPLLSFDELEPFALQYALPVDRSERGAKPPAPAPRPFEGLTDILLGIGLPIIGLLLLAMAVSALTGKVWLSSMPETDLQVALRSASLAIFAFVCIWMSFPLLKAVLSSVRDKRKQDSAEGGAENDTQQPKT